MRSTVLCLVGLLAGAAHALDLELDGKQPLVTGSTSGIGYAIAKLLLTEGADVIVNGRTQETVDAAVGRLREETGKTAKASPPTWPPPKALLQFMQRFQMLRFW